MKGPFCKRVEKVSRTKIEAQEKALEKGMRAYKCEFCEFWHLTSREWVERPQFIRKEIEEHDY